MESDRPAGFRFSARAVRTGAQPIGELMAAAVENPELISLAAGLVDQDTLPSEPSRELADRLLRSPAAKRSLQYGATAGLDRLRRTLFDHMLRLDRLAGDRTAATEDDVVITTGSQQLLFLLTDVLVDLGDIVITGWPSYFVYTSALAGLGVEVRCVDLDRDGIIPERLESLLADLADRGELHRVKILYVIPDHQNPTGITLAPERRPALLDVVRRYSHDHRILVIEDAAYRELTYEGEPAASLKSYDPANELVALCQTFSKPFSPGLKTGYGLLPRDLVSPVLLQKGGHDFGSANFPQHLLQEAMEEGLYHDHVAALRRAYAAKRDAMLEALASAFRDFPPGSVRWTRPAGGLYVWVTLPEDVATGPRSALFRRAVDRGVLYVPGTYCYPDDPQRRVPGHTLRLSFGSPTVEQIRTGVHRLADAVRDH